MLFVLVLLFAQGGCRALPFRLSAALLELLNIGSCEVEQAQAQALVNRLCGVQLSAIAQVGQQRHQVAAVGAAVGKIIPAARIE
ncbi:hypothetical protein D3C84_836040 [compost metagenome]